MTVIEAKVISIISLFLLTVIFAICPVKLSSWALRGGRFQRSVMTLGTCFSGGILLGVALLHLLPEVREMFDSVLCEKNVKSEYPLTELSVGGGFLIILIFEQVVLLFHRPRPRSECNIADVPPHGCNPRQVCDNCGDGEDANDDGNEGDGGGDVEDSVSQTSADSSTRRSKGDRMVALPHSNPAAKGCTMSYQNGCVPMVETNVTESNVDGETDVPAISEGHISPSVIDQVGNEVTVRSVYPTAQPTVVTVTEGDGIPAVSVVRPSEEPARAEDSAFGSLVLLAALSLHSLFEGLALGLQKTSNSTLQVFVAVLFHKCVLAFAMGIRMVKANSPTKRIVLAAIIFAVMSPLGALLGIAVDKTASSDVDRELATACLQGIATGTFLFVTFLEVISHEVQSNRSGDADIQMLKLVVIVLGYVAIALIELRGGHDHGSEEHGDHCH